MRKIAVAILMVAMVCTSLFAQGGAEAATIVTNAEKPVVFFNRQPSDPVTGAIDMDVMNWIIPSIGADNCPTIYCTAINIPIDISPLVTEIAAK